MAIDVRLVTLCVKAGLRGFTYVRLVSSVCSLVDIKVRFLIKTLRASIDGALITFLATFLTVCNLFLEVLMSKVHLSLPSRVNACCIHAC